MVGVLYAGSEVTFYWHIFERLSKVLLGLSVVFIAISAFVGQWMAKRAMVPIVKSFAQQKEFVADASHELRTPLSVLNSSLEVIEMEQNEHLSDFSRDVLLDMKDEVRSMTRLVSDLLTLARSDLGTLEILHETVDLSSIAEKLERSMQPLAASQQIELQLETPETLVVTGDQERLKQLLYILLDNAIKYTPAGGKVTLVISSGRVEQKEMCCIRVQDTGIGIPVEQQERIFERFFRVDKNRSRKMGGTGLGLAIAKWIVEAHRGNISVESAPGSGSTFTVWIPVKAK